MESKKRSFAHAHDTEQVDDFGEFVKLLSRGPNALSSNGGFSVFGFKMNAPPLSVFDQNAWVVASNNKTLMDRLSSVLSLVHKYDGELEAKENLAAKRIVQWLDLIKQKLVMFTEERQILQQVVAETASTSEKVWNRIEAKVTVEKTECSRAMDEFSIWIDELVVAITVMRNKEESTMLRSAPWPSPKRVERRQDKEEQGRMPTMFHPTYSVDDLSDYSDSSSDL